MFISKLKSKRIVSLLLLAFALVLMFVPSAVPRTVDAGFGLCRGLGANLQTNSSIQPSSVVAPSAEGRKWTVQELFGNATDFTTYTGETSSTTGDGWLLYDTSKDARGKGYSGWDDSKIKTKLQGARSTARCTMGPSIATFGSIGLALSNFMIWLGSQMISQLFNPTFICSDPKSTSGCAINLIATIGGVNNQDGEGIIGNLFNSIYQPLIALAFLFTAGWLTYKGLIKREFRASLQGLIWALAIFFIGTIAMLRPTMLASAPQQVNSAIGSCIIGAMDGKSCADGHITAPSSMVGTECESQAATKGNQGAEMAVNGMTCTLWKTFVLDSWSRTEFGRSYNDLYVANVPKTGHKWAIPVSNPNKYCIHLKSSKSADDFNGGNVTTGEGKAVCNLALYQLYLRSGLNDPSNTSVNHSKTSAYDSRFYNIILPAAKDDTMWAAWAPGTLTGGFQRIITPLTTFIIVTACMASLIVFAFWGLVYSFAGTLLMAFSPLFFLVAVDPGRGKRIFLGWLESLFSSILKYMASALFVIIALALYSGILNNTSNYASAFIGILIMVGVMFTYRKEIINLLGQANLGGQKLTNAVGEKIKDRAHRTKEVSEIMAGSAIGSKIAGGTALHGATEGLRRQMMRNNSFTGGLAREAYMTHRRLAKDDTNNSNDGSDSAPNSSAPFDSNNDNQRNQTNPAMPNNSDKPPVSSDDGLKCPNDGTALVNGKCPKCGYNTDDRDADLKANNCKICGAKLNKDGSCPNSSEHDNILKANNQTLDKDGTPISINPIQNSSDSSSNAAPVSSDSSSNSSNESASSAASGSSPVSSSNVTPESNGDPNYVPSSANPLRQGYCPIDGTPLHKNGNCPVAYRHGKKNIRDDQKQRKDLSDRINSNAQKNPDSSSDYPSSAGSAVPSAATSDNSSQNNKNAQSSYSEPKSSSSSAPAAKRPASTFAERHPENDSQSPKSQGPVIQSKAIRDDNPLDTPNPESATPESSASSSAASELTPRERKAKELMDKNSDELEHATKELNDKKKQFDLSKNGHKNPIDRMRTTSDLNKAQLRQQNAAKKYNKAVSDFNMQSAKAQRNRNIKNSGNESKFLNKFKPKTNNKETKHLPDLSKFNKKDDDDK